MRVRGWREIRARGRTPEQLAEMDRRVSVWVAEIELAAQLADAGRAAYFGGDPPALPEKAN